MLEKQFEHKNYTNEEEQFYKQFPTDQDYIDYKHRQKYGEY